MANLLTRNELIYLLEIFEDSVITEDAMNKTLINKLRVMIDDDDTSDENPTYYTFNDYE